MALLNCNFFSKVLGFSTSMTVILPQSMGNQIGIQGKLSKNKPPVLYLLHGFSDDHTLWTRYTSIERYAAQHGIAVIMPNVHLSFYTDMKNGGKYWTFIGEELPGIVNNFFNISNKPEKTFVAGLSMGGYGAFKLAFSYPKRYAGAASFSGALDVLSFYSKAPKSKKKILKRDFGDIERVPESLNDLYFLAYQLAESKTISPKLYQTCGTEDHLYQDNIRFRDFLTTIGLQPFYEECPGMHEWSFWDKSIQRYLELISNEI